MLRGSKSQRGCVSGHCQRTQTFPPRCKARSAMEAMTLVKLVLSCCQVMCSSHGADCRSGVSPVMPQVQPGAPGAGLSLELLVASLSKFLLADPALPRERWSRQATDREGRSSSRPTLPHQLSGCPRSHRLPQALTQGGGGKL